ncbi:hypothetical protein JOEDIRT_120 [Mycobacterium phage JoeDirt]|uniref:Uncharacterized protein n=2 Tax=Mycobacterium virus JoeDirt TaxID=1034137 RepID=G1BQP0_9CAUD|nr:hypothetical protein FGG55_gp118 [Mycobacterium phage JoeDirt]AEK07143.1 hypothetical protein JOEDIRT_120 [Mycobacterium phage JoeDirt]AYD82303.1 hypothetical protein SEA_WAMBURGRXPRESS_119 [Mycobacterium phage Wamburgrxpress]
MDRVIVNLVINIDLEQWADAFQIVGPRGARDDLKSLALQAVQHELNKHGFDTTVTLK